MHHIRYIDYPRDVDRRRVLQDFREMADAAGDGYHSKLTWHDGKVHPDREAAIEAIERYDDGWYDDHAVLFRDVEAAPASPRTEAAQARLDAARERLAKAERESDVRRRKRASVTCPRCGSRIALARFKGRDNTCPVCLEADLRSPSTLERLASLREAVERAERKLAEARCELGDKAEVRWLVKCEFHS